jgi:hypothetical protein
MYVWVKTAALALYEVMHHEYSNKNTYYRHHEYECSAKSYRQGVSGEHAVFQRSMICIDGEHEMYFQRHPSCRSHPQGFFMRS